MNTLTVFFISVAKTIYIICNTIILNYCITFCNSLFEFLYAWSNNVDIWGNIANWISAIFSIIAGIVIPLKLYELGKKDELARKTENEINEKKNQELLSIERRGKLHSKSRVDETSSILMTLYNSNTPNIFEFLKRECVISENDITNNNFFNYKNLKLTFNLKEETSIDSSNFLLKEIDIHLYDNEEEYINSYFYKINLDNEPKNIFTNNMIPILNINVLFNKTNNFEKELKNCKYIFFVIKLNIINLFKIQTNCTWNVKAINESNIWKNTNNNLSIKIPIDFSLLNVEQIIDKNLE